MKQVSLDTPPAKEMTEEDIGTICPESEYILLSGLWFLGELNIEDLSQYLLPVLIMQTTLILVVTRFLAYLLKPYGQPRIVPELIVSTSCATLLVTS